MKVKRNCFVCRKKLRGVWSGKYLQDFGEGPDDGIFFTTSGNYGSAVLDRMPGEPRVEISICDDCFFERKEMAINFTTEENIKACPTEAGYFGTPRKHS